MGPQKLRLPLFDLLSPTGFEPGKIFLIEFEPHSVWYEASYTIAAHAIQAGLRTDYHVFQHEPSDVVEALTRLGVKVEAARRKGLLRILDSFTPQAGLTKTKAVEPYGFVSTSLRLKEWKRAASRVLADSEERDILHIDDNDSLLATVNTEEEILDFFQSRAFAAARSKHITFLHGFATGVHHEPFYRRLEAFVDVILDFGAQERHGQLDQVVRARVVRGTVSDSRWRLLTVSRRGEVRVHGLARSSGPPFPADSTPESPVPGRPPTLKVGVLTPPALRVYEFLLEAFRADQRADRSGSEEAGWRSLVQISRGIGRSPSALYPRSGAVNPALRELEAQNLVEARTTAGSRGRGGVATKLRVPAEVANEGDLPRVAERRT